MVACGGGGRGREAGQGRDHRRAGRGWAHTAGGPRGERAELDGTSAVVGGVLLVLLANSTSVLVGRDPSRHRSTRDLDLCPAPPRSISWPQADGYIRASTTGNRWSASLPNYFVPLLSPRLFFLLKFFCHVGLSEVVPINEGPCTSCERFAGSSGVRQQTKGILFGVWGKGEICSMHHAVCVWKLLRQEVCFLNNTCFPLLVLTCACF
jgi:hypothetical protein